MTPDVILDDPYLQELLTRLDATLDAESGTGSQAAAQNPQGAAPSGATPGAKPVEGAIPGSVAFFRQLLSGSGSPEAAQDKQPAEQIAQPSTEPVTKAEVPFTPVAPSSLAEAQLVDSEVESLVLKFLLNEGNATGRKVATQICLPFCVVTNVLAQMKADQLIVHKGDAPLGDYLYQLTTTGRENARAHFRHCSYYGASPVHLSDYIISVQAQSVTAQRPTIDDMDHVFADLLLNTALQNQIGQAIHAGHGFFLYGAPGNGKTSVAERVARAFGQTVWIPRAIGVGGEIIRVYDPCKHVEVPLEEPEGIADANRVDRRWVRIRRPTIVVGGELTMEQLEITRNTSTGVSEAPLQLKSNCGTLVIDDFGRQRISVLDLLNRWIVPLDRHFDLLNLACGKTIQVPFDQVLIFSTNLQPRDLVDEAFLRRMPYKIEVLDPTEAEFRELFRMYGDRFGFEYNEEAVQYLIQRHYRDAHRAFRYCQPRDLLSQVRNFCNFNKRPLAMTPDGFDMAVRNYFAVMG